MITLNYIINNTLKVLLFTIFIFSLDSYCNSTDEKLNVIWISCEDMGPVLGTYGVKEISTPNIDKLADEGINVDLVNNPELVNSTKYALPAALAFLDYAGLSDETANTMSTKQLNNLINSGANAKIANERWDSVISSLKSAGKKEEAADMALRNEYKAQKKVGVTQDGSIGPISRKAMLSWLDKKGVTIRPDNDDDMELVKLVNRTK